MISFIFIVLILRIGAIMELVGSLCIILIATTIAGQISVKLGFPAVIGQLLVGIIIGPSLFNLIKLNESIDIFSEIGIIILMFIGGLESDIKLLKKYFGTSSIVAIIGVLVPFVSAYFIGKAFNINQLESLVLGIIFSATSVSISVAVLKDMNQIDTPEGTTILGAAVIDDILAIIILSLFLTFFQSTKANNQQSIWIVLGQQVIFFIVLAIASYWIIPWLINLSKKIVLPASEIIVALVICFTLAFIANEVGLSSAIGAFFAGLAVGQTKESKTINKQVEPIGYAIFIPVFFVSIGLKINLVSMSSNIWLFVALTITGIFSKWIGAGLGALIGKFNLKSSSIIGAGMISRGEMALIIAQMEFNNHVLSTSYYSAIIGAIIIITLFSPIILRNQIKTKQKARNN